MSNIIVVNPFMQGGGSDLSAYEPEAAAWIAGVEAADGEPLESGFRDAVNAFVAGCKTDGIWDDIIQCGILRGPRTLAGLLHPLAGATPENNNFVLGDYGRKTGLAGNGSTKYLRLPVAHQQFGGGSLHMSVFVNTAASSSGQIMIGVGGGSACYSHISVTSESVRCYIQNNNLRDLGDELDVGFMGIARSGTAASARVNGSTSSYTDNAIAPRVASTDRITLFARNYENGPLDAYSDVRLSFYSLGHGLTLAALGSRVSTLMADIAAAIP